MIDRAIRRLVGLGFGTVLLIVVVHPAPSAPLSEWDLSYNDGGGGIELESPEGDFRYRQLGYLQVRGDLFNDEFARTEGQTRFTLRRARLDWIVDVRDKYRLLLEIDGADFNGPDSSDFDLVVARISGPFWPRGRWTVGKFITPFSTENNRSSRSLDMIERYLALNSLFLLPALDVQFGGELKYPLAERWTATVGIFNGNGRAGDNLSDDNRHKEVQLRLEHRYSKHLEWAASFDRSHEEPQTLPLEGYTFTDYSSVAVDGTRRILGGSFDYTSHPFSLRGEGLRADFPDVDARLSGGYLQPAYFHHGDRNGGLQYLLRLDTAHIEKDEVAIGGDAIHAVTLGLNWYLNGNVRLKVNAVGEEYDGEGNNVTRTGTPSGVQEEGFHPYLLTELQFKF